MEQDKENRKLRTNTLQKKTQLENEILKKNDKSCTSIEIERNPFPDVLYAVNETSQIRVETNTIINQDRRIHEEPVHILTRGFSNDNEITIRV